MSDALLVAVFNTICNDLLMKCPIFIRRFSRYNAHVLLETKNI